MKNYFAGVAVVVGLAAVFVLWRRSEAVPSGIEPVIERSSSTPDDARQEPEQARVAIATDPEREVADAVPPRKEVVPSVLFGRAVDELGNGIAGAVVSWTPVDELAMDERLAWSQIDWQKLSSKSLVTTTDEDGGFAFVHEVEPTAYGSVVWITHLSHVAASVLLSADGLQDAGAQSVVMQSAGRRSVRVVEADGATVPKATVDVYGAAFDHDRSPFERRLLGLLHRRVETGTDGTATLPVLPEENVLIAHEGQRVSLPRRGSGRESFTLELAETFVASGQVLSGEPSSAARVVCGAVFADERTVLGAAPIEAGGRWGPVNVSVANADEYWFRLEGADYVREEVRVPAPPPGHTLVVDFKGEAGLVMWFYVQDLETEEPLFDGLVEVRWVADGVETVVEGRAREDGYVRISGCRPGPVPAFITCSGYAPADRSELVIPFPVPATTAVGLRRAGRLAGKVLENGQPVTDFGLSVRRQGDRHESRTTFWSGRADGSFEMDDAPLGAIQVIAFVEEHVQSRVESAVVRDGSAAQVVLELAEPCTGAGRVVDQVTSEPLSDATVQLHATIDDVSTHPLGRVISVRTDGAFEAGGFYSEGTRYTVTAPGYEVLSNVLAGTPGHVTDLGDIALVAQVRLTIELVAEHSINPTEFAVQSVDGETIPYTVFGPDGIVEISGVSPGSIELDVEYPRGGGIYVTTFLPPGRDTTVLVPVDGPCQLEVEFLPATGKELPVGASLFILSYDRSKGFNTRAIFIEESVLRLDLPCVDLELWVGSAGGKSLTGRKYVSLDGVSSAAVSIRLEPSAFLIRVVDARDEPVAGVKVRVGVPGAKTVTYGETDADGRVRCAVQGDHRNLSAMLFHPALGTRGGVPIGLTGTPNEEIEVLFDPQAFIEVIVMDGDVPVANADLSLYDRTLLREIVDAHVASDASGLLRWERVTAGEYDVIGGRVDYFPVRATVRTGAAKPHVVQMRKLGGLDIIVTDEATGAILPDVQLSLRDVEYGDVMRWPWVRDRYANGKLVSDSDGRIELERLPEGFLTWSVRSSDGQASDGRIEVIGGTTTTTTIGVR